MNLFRSLEGMLSCRITSGDIGLTLCTAAEQGIPLYQVVTEDPLTAVLLISRRHQKQLLALCEKRGDQVAVLGQIGLYWRLKALWGHRLLTLGLIGILTFFLILPTKVLFLQVEGNRTLPEAKILDAVRNTGVYFGCSRKKLRSEGIKNALLEQLPQLSWAGINTRGCVAVISVTERAPEPVRTESDAVSSIVAARDGIIESCTATRGTMLCKPDQAVTQGQILISGYTQNGNTIRGQQARGEVFGRTKRELTVISPSEFLYRWEKTEEKNRISLLIGKKRINFPWNSGIWDTSCGRMYAEYYITLPGGYVLPVALAISRYQDHEVRRITPEAEGLQDVLSEFAEQYLKQQMIAGTIVSSTLTLSQTEGAARMEGRYLCREMLGRSRQEQIGESYGEEHRTNP